MVTGGREGATEAGEQAAAIVLDRRALPVHELPGTDHLPAEGRAHRLMSEAHAENRHPGREALDRRHRDARILRTARTGRNDDVRRRERFDLVERHHVVAPDQHLGAHLAQVLCEVEGERVVVVDQQEHGLFFGLRSSVFGLFSLRSCYGLQAAGYGLCGAEARLLRSTTPLLPQEGAASAAPASTSDLFVPVPAH